MCSIADAEHHHQLAALCRAEDPAKARQHFLEAASIFVLQAELSHNDQLLEQANQCYAQSQAIAGKKLSTYSKQELAQRTLTELEEFSQSHHHDLLHEITRSL